MNWSFTIHTQPPEITIASHKPNQFINKSPIMTAGTISSAPSAVMNMFLDTKQPKIL
ncbi:MAG TPA: hypothetical protein VL197_12790 [Nitrospirota bacterium]|nr:hypothetical protein [Nitrospirota bacterium]